MKKILNHASNDHLTWLLARFAERQEKNPKLSLRSYARWLGISPATLSQIFSGKRHLSLSTATKIAKRECRTADERRRFLERVIHSQAERPEGTHEPQNYTQIETDQFSLIADWYHFAILSLANIPGNRIESHWISNRLGITVSEAQAALSRLLRMSLIKRNGTGFLATNEAMTTPLDVPSEAVRRSHQQVLKKAAAALTTVPVKDRDFSVIMMAVDPAKLPAAKDIICKFRDDLAAVLEQGKSQQIYACAVQLFPLTKSQE